MSIGQQPPAPGDSLGSGAAGITLLHIQEARTGNGSWAKVHQWATAMTRDVVTAHVDSASLYRGAPAVAFVLRAANQQRYMSVIEDLDVYIDGLTRLRLRRANKRLDSGGLPELREYDLISGLTGIGVYLLRRNQPDELLRDVLRYLVRLTEPIHDDGESLPGWWCAEYPSHLGPPRWPGGHGNLGLAHGIAGPLALLAITMRCGLVVDGHADAIGRIVVFLDQCGRGAGARRWWPGWITRAEWLSGVLAQAGPQRPSWCYGTPGIARAQQLAAIALDDQRRQRAVEEIYAACLADEQQLALLTDPTLCHGWAGLAHTTRRAAADAGAGSELTEAYLRLRRRLDQRLEGQEHATAAPGLLEGSAGIRLARSELPLTPPGEVPWDACLLTC